MWGFPFKDMVYSTSNDFSGRMNISSTYYNEKPIGSEIAKIRFNEMTVSNDLLASFISSGYCYCPTDRKLEKVRESDYICIDVDDSTVEMNEYVSNLTDKPTIYYTTPSNGNIEKSRQKFGDDKHIYRFRLLYALDTPTTNATEYEQAFRYITSTNNMTSVDYRRANQYYNGSKGCELHNTNRVYSLPDEYKDVVPASGKEKGDRPKPKRPAGGPSSNEGTSGTALDADVLSAFLDCTKYEDFLSWYGGEFGASSLLRESPYLPDKEDERKLVCDEYFVIPKKYAGWDRENKTKIYGRWLDGEDRHTKLYVTGVILRKLNPTASANDLLREIVSILLGYYNIFDPGGKLKFNKKNILQLLDSVLKADLTKKMKEIKHPSFRVSSYYCDKNRVSKKQVLGSLLGEKNRKKKEEKYSEIDYFYDPNLSLNDGKKITQKQWIEILLENGVIVSLRTFKSYLSDRGFSKTNKRKETKKSATRKPNTINHYSIRFASCTFWDDEDDIQDDSLMNPDRQFREIIGRIHDTDEFKRKWAV